MLSETTEIRWKEEEEEEEEGDSERLAWPGLVFICFLIRLFNFPVWADKYETETKKHPPATRVVIYWMFWWNTKLCMKFVTLVLTIRGRYITTI